MTSKLISLFFSFAMALCFFLTIQFGDYIMSCVYAGLTLWNWHYWSKPCAI